MCEEEELFSSGEGKGESWRGRRKLSTWGKWLSWTRDERVTKKEQQEFKSGGQGQLTRNFFSLRCFPFSVLFQGPLYACSMGFG